MFGADCQPFGEGGSLFELIPTIVEIVGLAGIACFAGVYLTRTMSNRIRGWRIMRRPQVTAPVISGPKRRHWVPSKRPI